MIRSVIGRLFLALVSPAVCVAQTTDHPRTPEGIGGVPVVLWEHGDPFLAVPPVLTIAGSVVFDIATAPASARLYNARNPDVPKSPHTAFILSLASTGAPLLVGAVAVNSSSGELGVALISGGVIVGPSVGHWYSGRFGRGLATAGVRLGLVVLGGLALLAAS